MDWVSGNTHNYRVQAKGCWHFWFAWYPVVVETFADGAVRRVWLQTVLRKGEYTCSYADCCWNYEYKEVTSDGRL